MARIYTLALMVLALVVFISCDRMKVGYLQTEDAIYVPDSIEVYRNLDESDLHLTENAPWSSSSIQGVSGTAPVNYEFYGVKATDGGDEAAFKKLFENGDAHIQGSIIQLFQNGVKRLPNGTYTISIRVYNEDHSAIVKDAFRFIVKDEETYDY